MSLKRRNWQEKPKLVWEKNGPRRLCDPHEGRAAGRSVMFTARPAPASPGPVMEFFCSRKGEGLLVGRPLF